MNVLTRSDIQKLATLSKNPAVSFFMNTKTRAPYVVHRGRFQSLLSIARLHLTEHTSYRVKHETLYPAYRLLHDREWWEQGQRGVAIFSAHNTLYAYHLTKAVPEGVVVGKRFHILPLLDHISHTSSLNIMALQQRNAHFLWGRKQHYSSAASK